MNSFQNCWSEILLTLSRPPQRLPPQWHGPNPHRENWYFSCQKSTLLGSRVRIQTQWFSYRFFPLIHYTYLSLQVEKLTRPLSLFDFRIIVFQSCVSFCYATMLIGHNFTYVFSPSWASLHLPIPPLQVSTEC